MKQEKERVKKKNSKLNFFGRYFAKKAIIVIVVLLIVISGVIGVRKLVLSDSKTTKIGFENIGELATQSAYCTEVNVTEAWRELFGITIPFTQSKYIYSYDIVIKAGFDFREIEWEEKNNTIEVKLPEAKILSSEVDRDSFKVYHEEESIFRQITLEENNEAMTTLVQTAEKDAIANGLLDHASSNAETVLTGFFANVFDLKKYEIVFTDK